MADITTAPSVSVLCALPVSDIYNIQHRVVYYVALACIVLAPAHKWLTPTALSFVIVYSFFATFYAIAMFIAPSRLGPTLDVFPVHGLLLTNTYAMGALVFCRPSFLKGKRQWGMCYTVFLWLWGAFVLANFDKIAFEKLVKKMTQTVLCHDQGSSSLPANIFSVGFGMVCENPCASGFETSAVMHPAQGQIRPTLWGSIDPITKQFKSRPEANMTWVTMTMSILFGVSVSSTLWLNFFTSPQTTRNTVFAIFARSRDSGVRVAIAKLFALAWFAWSYMALLLVALALPFVAWVQEELYKRYPIAHTMCAVKQWAPWLIATGFALIKVAAIRRRKHAMKKLRQSRRLRLKNAINHIQSQVDLLTLLPEHATPSDESTTRESVLPTKEDQQQTPSKPQEVKYRFEIAEVREINGFLDGLVELREWWSNPVGLKEQTQAASNLPAIDEEKALLKDHYEQDE